jgi:RNA-directed DNA polymerase
MSKETFLREIVWDEINWSKTIKDVRRTQRRIYRAKQTGNIKRVWFIQKQLMMSPSASLVAVHMVTTLNKGNKTAGCDGILSLDSKEKIKLAINIRIDGKASGIKKVWSPKTGKTEKRHIGISIMVDRVKQALAKLILEPEWEAVFEPNSYGLRPGRRDHDAIEAIHSNLHENEAKWVFHAAINKCFEKINHETLIKKLGTFPLMEKQIHAWLKSGILDEDVKEEQLTYPILGTPQGSVISPLFCNIALHGLENHLKEFITTLPNSNTSQKRENRAKRSSLGVIRYAADFVLIHRDLETLENCVIESQKWLRKVDLTISETKSKTVLSTESFKFLGFQITTIVSSANSQEKIKIQIIPSKESRKQLTEKIRHVLQTNKSASAYNIIGKLRPIILGWGNYFQFCECKNVFNQMDNVISNQLRAWVFRRSIRIGRQQTKTKYFPEDRIRSFQGRKYQANWILEGVKANDEGIPQKNFLPKISWIKSKNYVKINEYQSPFNGDDVYWALRTPRYSSFSTRVNNLIEKQKCKCPRCKISFVTGDTMEVDHILSLSKRGKDVYTNLQLLHRECHLQKTKEDLTT